MRWKDYEARLEERLPHLHEEVQKVSYRAKPVKRTYITKEDGSLRPLGVTCVEDKLVQQAVSTVLLSVYEADFHGFSYGFRANRGAHDALDALTTAISRHRVNWILEADIKAFFDRVPHETLFELLDKRIGDQRLLRLIRKWLNWTLRGHGYYFGVPGNSRALKNIREILMKEWMKVLRRRSQKGRKLTWEKFNKHINRLILRLRICHPYPEVRFYAKHPRQEPYAVVPHVRICAGGAG